MNVTKLWHTFNLLIRRNGFARAEYLKMKNLLGSVGEDCFFHPYWMPSDPKSIFLHNNVIITADTTFITHDIIGAMLNRKNATKDYQFYLAPIEIYDNVAIGARTVILPGRKIGPNAIVGAGTVVNMDVPEGAVVAGNPARIIGTVEEFEQKRLREQLLMENRENVQN